MQETSLSRDTQADLCWWVIHGADLLNLLHRASNGESPDMLYAEWYANSDHEQVDGR